MVWCSSIFYQAFGVAFSEGHSLRGNLVLILTVVTVAYWIACLDHVLNVSLYCRLSFFIII